MTIKLKTIQKTDRLCFEPAEGWNNVTKYSAYEYEICDIMNEGSDIKVHLCDTRYFQFHMEFESSTGEVKTEEDFESTAKKLTELCAESALIPGKGDSQW